ncbi:MAG: hypothetical protein ACOCZE_13470 [Planctomycetota bacterium]
MTIKKWRLWLPVLALMVVPVAGAQQVEHPRLFVTADRLAKVRQAIAVPGSHHAQAFELLKKRISAGTIKPYNDERYGRSYAAREAALCSLLATDLAEKKRYAQQAYSFIEEMYSDPKAEAHAYKGKGLARGMMSLGIAIAYDWCYPVWTEQQRRFVEGKMDQALDAWPKFGHVNVSGHYGSNWAAVCRGAELILILARGDETRREGRYKRVKNNLMRHMQTGFGSLGVSQEGVGYIEYPGGFLLPACYAAESIGDDELARKARSIGWSKMAMYTHSFQGRARKFIMSGVAHSSNFNEGWLSLLLHHAGDDHLPYYLWFYDRAMGSKSAMQPEIRFDGERAGTVWALLYYPTDLEPKDPTGVMPKAVADNRGYFFFRNRWKDANDIQTSIMADESHHSHAWDQPENLAINLLALNTRFIGGPGKERGDEKYSSLLVDGKYNVRKSVDMNGKTIDFQASPQGGQAVVDGGELYKALGVEQARRQMLVRFSDPAANVGVLSIFDDIGSEKDHTYTWQANLAEESGSGDIEVSTSTHAGRPAFALSGGNGKVHGWVIHPADAKITSTKDPLRIETSGKDRKIWVVLYVGDKKPDLLLKGRGLETVVKLGDLTLSYDGQSGRIAADR